MEYLKREEIFEYVKNQYGTVPEYLWETSPKSAVLRHKNGKWYAVLLDGRVSEAKILDFLDLSYDLIDQKKD